MLEQASRPCYWHPEPASWTSSIQQNAVPGATAAYGDYHCDPDFMSVIWESEPLDFQRKDVSFPSLFLSMLLYIPSLMY